MSETQKNREILNDLLSIQYERATAYERIARYADPEEPIFRFLKKIAAQSHNDMLELRSYIDIGCGDPADWLEIKGEIYRSWPGIKHFSPASRPAEVISTCEHNEMATVIAFQKALVSVEGRGSELQWMIVRQLKIMIASYLFIHEYKKKPDVPVTPEALIRPI